MLFNFPSFIGKKEQTKSELLFNCVKILIQTQLGEIWADTTFGTDIRDNIKQGIDGIVIFKIEMEIRDALSKYFSDDLIIQNLDIAQSTEDLTKLLVDLTYIELRTGINYTLHTEEDIPNVNYLLS